MYILAHYDGLVPEIIRRVKYAGEHSLLGDISRIIADRYENKYAFEYLVPVPLARKRLEERGFNQAEKLARELYSVFSIKYSVSKPEVIDLLVRARETKPQFELKYDERKKNVAEAFAISPLLLSNSLTGYSFCLVDDVATTGATIFECAKVLKRAGADKVWAMCLARGG